LTAPLRIAVIGGGIGGLAAAVSLLRVEFDVDVYEKAPQLNEVSGDIRGGVPWRRAREIVAEPMVCGLTAGGKWIRTLGPARTGNGFEPALVRPGAPRSDGFSGSEGKPLDGGAAAR
jgi:glycine/D-amino acid oxidase-like deaminating enzyme